MDIGPKFAMVNLSLLLNTGEMFAFLSDYRKSSPAQDLFIKIESIVTEVMTFVLRMLVAMLSYPTLSLFFKFLMIFVLKNRCLMKIVFLWNLIIKVTFKCKLL